jgi:hypothetical protein
LLLPIYIFLKKEKLLLLNLLLNEYFGKSI